MFTISLCPTDSRSHLGFKRVRICLHSRPTCLDHLIQQVADLHSCVPPCSRTKFTRYRNINLFSIAYAFRPRLRDRLTLSRLTLLRKPWAFGERVSHPLYRYSCQHDLFRKVQPSSRSTFLPYGMLPYPTYTPHELKNRINPALKFHTRHTLPRLR